MSALRQSKLIHAVAVAVAFAFTVAVALALASVVAVVLAFDLPGSLPKRRTRREKPEGRRTWMCAVRGRGRMPLPRIPSGSRTRSAQRGGRVGRARFLLVTFSLREQRKVTRPKGRKPLKPLLLLLPLLEVCLSDEKICKSGFSRDSESPLCLLCLSRLKPLL
ncbi:MULTISPECIES: hypothetical protein [Xanthomonas]|uniref:hypothetical protein n=1 Tax=Xanthomonas TaxID=338 RepID=UPI00186B2789|nr:MULTISPECIES: hypothetical protein [Xanthomonas]